MAALAHDKETVNGVLTAATAIAAHHYIQSITTDPITPEQQQRISALQSHLVCRLQPTSSNPKSSEDRTNSPLSPVEHDALLAIDVPNTLTQYFASFDKFQSLANGQALSTLDFSQGESKSRDSLPSLLSRFASWLSINWNQMSIYEHHSTFEQAKKFAAGPTGSQSDTQSTTASHNEHIFDISFNTIRTETTHSSGTRTPPRHHSQAHRPSHGLMSLAHTQRAVSGGAGAAARLADVGLKLSQSEGSNSATAGHFTRHLTHLAAGNVVAATEDLAIVLNARSNGSSNPELAGLEALANVAIAEIVLSNPVCLDVLRKACQQDEKKKNNPLTNDGASSARSVASSSQPNIASPPMSPAGQSTLTPTMAPPSWTLLHFIQHALRNAEATAILVSNDSFLEQVRTSVCFVRCRLATLAATPFALLRKFHTVRVAEGNIPLICAEAIRMFYRHSDGTVGAVRFLGNFCARATNPQTPCRSTELRDTTVLLVARKLLDSGYATVAANMLQGLIDDLERRRAHQAMWLVLLTEAVEALSEALLSLGDLRIDEHCTQRLQRIISQTQGPPAESCLSPDAHRPFTSNSGDWSAPNSPVTQLSGSSVSSAPVSNPNVEVAFAVDMTRARALHALGRFSEADDVLERLANEATQLQYYTRAAIARMIQFSISFNRGDKAHDIVAARRRVNLDSLGARNCRYLFALCIIAEFRFLEKGEQVQVFPSPDELSISGASVLAAARSVRQGDDPRTPKVLNMSVKAASEWTMNRSGTMSSSALSRSTVTATHSSSTNRGPGGSPVTEGNKTYPPSDESKLSRPPSSQHSASNAAIIGMMQPVPPKGPRPNRTSAESSKLAATAHFAQDQEELRVRALNPVNPMKVGLPGIEDSPTSIFVRDAKPPKLASSGNSNKSEIETPAPTPKPAVQETDVTYMALAAFAEAASAIE